MLRVVLLTLLLVSAAGTARAEDFTGFYAGVNAGYAFGRSETRTARGVTSPTPSRERPGAAAPDLPPSAAEAAATLRGGQSRSESR